MLTLLSILTGGGLIGGIAMLILRPALRTTALGILQSIPPRIWYALAIMALLFGVIWWHGSQVNAARKEGKQAGRAEVQAELELWKQAARDWKRATDSKSQTISILTGERYNEDLRRNAAVADDLRLRGPGKAAACHGSRRDTGVAGAAGGPESPAPSPDAPRGPVPAGDGFAVVPWGWLVERAEDHDRLLAESKAWRSWYDGQRRVHEAAVAALRAKMPEPEFGK